MCTVCCEVSSATRPRRVRSPTSARRSGQHMPDNVATTPRPIGFLGLSHLGIVTSAAWASFGDPIIAFDSSTDLVERMAGADPPVAEPHLVDLLVRQRANLTFSSDPDTLAACEVVVVTQDVPTDLT